MKVPNAPPSRLHGARVALAVLAVGLWPRAVCAQPSSIPPAEAYSSALAQGATAYAEGNYTLAVVDFQSAVRQRPEVALGHLRLAEALGASGQLEAMVQTVARVLRMRGAAAEMARAYFLLADAQERAGHLAEAAQTWAVYERFARSQPATSGAFFPEVAAERRARIERHLALERDYAALGKRQSPSEGGAVQGQ